MFETEREKWIWVAGILEGEGSFFLKTNHPGCARITCQMTDFDVIEQLRDICGGTVSYHDRKPGYWKPIASMNLVGPAAEKVMRNILPFMKSRRTEKINEVLLACENYKESVRLKQAERDARMQAAVEEYNNGGTTYRKLAAKYTLGKDQINREVMSQRV